MNVDVCSIFPNEQGLETFRDIRSYRVRLAFLIWIADYTHAGKLRNPVHDIELMTHKLERLGFKVTKILN